MTRVLSPAWMDDPVAVHSLRKKAISKAKWKRRRRIAFNIADTVLDLLP